MLQNTFCHIPSVGIKSERKLWDAGYTSWESILDHPAPESVLGGKTRFYLQHLEESRQHLEARDISWFEKCLPAKQLWRLFGAFHENAAYLDIESTGLGPPNEAITAISFYDGSQVHSYVSGRNLEDFATDIQDYSLLVTFNGKCFDIPCIERCMGLKLPQAHLDLRFVLGAAGVRGGLKACEKHFGLDRGDLDGVNGYDAVLLWRAYEQRKDERILDTLLAYNIEDVLSLEVLACHAYNLLLDDTPFNGSHRLEIPTPGYNPVQPHRWLLEEIRSAHDRGEL